MFWNSVFFLMGFAIAYYKFNFLKNISCFFTTLESRLSNLKSLYKNILETENNEKGEQRSFRWSSVFKCCKFVYYLCQEQVIIHFRKRLFTPIFLNNNKVLYPLFVHNDIKYIALSNSSSMNKTDVLGVRFNPEDLTGVNKYNEKLLLSVLNIFEMEKLKPDDFNVESIKFDVLNKFYELTEVRFEKNQPILL
jgi:hypothetical protein